MKQKNDQKYAKIRQAKYFSNQYTYSILKEDTMTRSIRYQRLRWNEPGIENNLRELKVEVKSTNIIYKLHRSATKTPHRIFLLFLMGFYTLKPEK